MENKKVALITGITGQDGSYLAEFLIEKGYEVHGTIRRSSVDFRERIAHLEGKPHFHLHYADLGDSMSILGVIGKVRPTEIYNLAAQSHVAVRQLRSPHGYRCRVADPVPAVLEPHRGLFAGPADYVHGHGGGHVNLVHLPEIKGEVRLKPIVAGEPGRVAVRLDDVVGLEAPPAKRVADRAALGQRLEAHPVPASRQG